MAFFGTKISKWDALSAALLTIIISFHCLQDGNIIDKLPSVSATEWKKIEFDYKDENITNRYCRQDNWRCINYTALPAPRTGHNAVLYTTFTKKQCEDYVYKCNEVKPRDKKKCKEQCEKTPKKDLARLKMEQKLIDDKDLQPWTNLTKY